MSCSQGCRTDDCAHQREGDTWLTPRQPVFLPPLAPEQPEPVHAPALTPDGFSEALRALGRDGGEPACGPHRLPEGPCEDISQCPSCGMPTWVMRPAGECFGHHAPDCSLPERHESFCVGGGSGHPTGLLRGWPEFTWTSR